MRAITAGVLTIGLLVSGCSSTEQPASSASPSASPSAAPSAKTGAETSAAPGAEPGPSTAPAPEPPPATNDSTGRDAFARYVLQAWIYSLNTNDAQALLDISGAKPCEGCAELAAELESRREAGWYVALEGVRVTRVELTGQGRSARAVMSVSIPESSTYNEDGSYRSSNPAHPRSTFEVAMAHGDRRFRLVAFSLY
jgi:hypothetical protein